MNATLLLALSKKEKPFVGRSSLYFNATPMFNAEKSNIQI